MENHRKSATSPHESPINTGISDFGVILTVVAEIQLFADSLTLDINFLTDKQINMESE